MNVNLEQNDSGQLKSDTVRMSFELVVLPVSNVERAKQFYLDLGWSCDLDFQNEKGDRVIQFTPPGSGSSIIFGSGVSVAKPGSVKGLHLIVADLDQARSELLSRGVAVSGAFHDSGGVFHRSDTRYLALGNSPGRKSYASYATFSDPDGNEWVLQEVTVRLPPRNQSEEARFTEQLIAAIHQAPIAK